MKTMARVVMLVLAISSCTGSGGGGTDGGKDGGGSRVLPPECLFDPGCEIPFACAHRGLCGGEPENTLAAFLNCERQGVPMLEIDTRETADGTVVIMHDSTVDRTTDGEQRYPGRTDVVDLTLEEFRSLVIDDGRCTGDPDADPDRCRPPTYAEILERTSQDTVIFIDFKTGDPAKVAAETQAHDAAGRVILVEDNLDRVRAFREALPGGLVMPRAFGPEDVDTLLSPEKQDLELLWIHGEPWFITDVMPQLRAAGVRLYVNGWDDQVDLWLGTAELTEDPDRKAEYETEAWRALDAMIEKGARGFGTNFAHHYAAHLYSDGFGSY